jgi:predicted GH43/DUF377 family glycosyl hydrolase
MSEPALAVRLGPQLRPDTSRVIARLFVPGEETPGSTSRGHRVIDRILALDDAATEAAMVDVMARFAGRHRDLKAVLREHFQVAAHGRPDLIGLPEPRQLLIGAHFTMEYAVEAAALFNPSMVAHPDQSGLRPGQVRFVMSVRAVGEGHLSSVGFRTGIIGPGTGLVLHDAGPALEAGTRRPVGHHRDLFLARLTELGADAETLALVFDDLPDRFDAAQLRQAVTALHPHLHARQAGQLVAEQINQIAATEYAVTFPSETAIDARLLWPSGPAESHGMEDVRLVRFVHDDGEVSYLGTYTAYDGSHIAPQLLTTGDFTSFEVGQLAGPAAINKGMALFPRQVAGQYLALSRWDRENVSLSVSADLRVWHRGPTLQAPRESWQLVQVGNCGSPIETDDGWLVLTHGVGPMRTYGIGALLLDLDDPTKVRAVLREPLLCATGEERDGYVPNVVYSCGALRHGDTLTIPYGISDTSIGFAQVDLPTLIASMGQPG